jgi:pyruvate, water dikinase
MDIEWGKDGDTGKLYIVQARPETVKSRGKPPDRALPPVAARRSAVRGPRIGQKIGSGVAAGGALARGHEPKCSPATCWSPT